jgi:general secretion pathway protein K
MRTTPTVDRSRYGRNGGALLMVLWLSAALSAIAFSLATAVRGETERTATAVGSVRAHYLATGALERAVLYMEWGPLFRLPDGNSRYYNWSTPLLVFDFPSGHAEVRIAPESSKLNVNTAAPEDLFRLLSALGADPERARQIAMGIVDWRSRAPADQPAVLAQDSLSQASTFQPRHASLEEIEELLLIRGMTPELYYGTYERDAQGHLVPRGGLRDCVTVYGATGGYDVNTVQPAVLAALGLSPDVIAQIAAARAQAPFRSMEQVNALTGGAPGTNRLRIGGYSIFTLRATARLRLQNGALSDERRSVAALVAFQRRGTSSRSRILRWYDNEWVQ